MSPRSIIERQGDPTPRYSLGDLLSSASSISVLLEVAYLEVEVLLEYQVRPSSRTPGSRSYEASLPTSFAIHSTLRQILAGFKRSQEFLNAEIECEAAPMRYRRESAPPPYQDSRPPQLDPSSLGPQGAGYDDFSMQRGSDSNEEYWDEEEAPSPVSSEGSSENRGESNSGARA